MTKSGDNKQSPSASCTVVRCSEAGLFIDFGRPSASDLECLKAGTGILAQQIEAAVQRWRAELGVDPDSEIVPVVLLYEHHRSDGPVAPGIDSHTEDSDE